MTRKTSILYPFSICQDNSYSFGQTLQLAKKIAAEVVCFTCVLEEKELDDVHLHLLALNGHFQTSFNDWKSTDIKMKTTIKIGQLKEQLLEYTKGSAYDFLICQPYHLILGESVLLEEIKGHKNRPQLLTFSNSNK